MEWGYLSDEDARVVELGLEDFLIKGFCVEMIARASFKWVSQVSYYNIKLLTPLQQLFPKFNPTINKNSKVIESSNIVEQLTLHH